MNKILASIEFTSLLAGITLIDIQNVLSVALMGVSLLVGFINLWLTIKKAVKDGQITEEEKQEIEDSIQEIKDKINKE